MRFWPCQMLEMRTALLMPSALRRSYTRSLWTCVSLLMAFQIQGCWDGGPRAGAADLCKASNVVARVGDAPVSLETLDATLEGQVYQMRADALKTLLMDELVRREAVSRGITPDQIYAQEVVAGAKLVEPAEAEALFKENKAGGNIASDMSYDEFVEALNGSRQRFHEHYRRTALFQKLAKSAQVKIDHVALGHRPAAVVSKGPELGPAGAPVRIVEFVDYTAEFAPLGNESLTNMLAEFEGKLHVSFRTVPADNPESRRVSVAALCAEDQGHFAAYRELLLLRPLDTSRGGVLELARRSKLDVDAFARCLDSESKSKLIAEHATDYNRAGLHGQPSWIINGFPIGGAIPMEDFRSIVSGLIDGVYL